MMYRLLFILLVPSLLLSKETLNNRTPADDYEYMIVCMTKYKDAFGAFIQFNERRALRTRLFTVDDAKAFSGADIQEKIRNMVKQEYTQHHIKYLLIASNNKKDDATSVPHRGFSAKCYDQDTASMNYVEDNNIPADMYYGCLDGDWKTDGIGGVHEYGSYGTEDIKAEVYVGRFCVDNAEQLNNCIKKTILYSEDPVLDSAVNNLLLSSHETYWGADFGWTSQYELQTLTGVSNASGITTCGFTAEKWNAVKIDASNCGDWETNKKLCDSLFYKGVGKKKCSWVFECGFGNTEYTVGSGTLSPGSSYPMGVLRDSLFALSDGIRSNFFFLVIYGNALCGAFDNLKYNGPSGYTYSPADCWAACASRLATGPVAVLVHSRFGIGAGYYISIAGPAPCSSPSAFRAVRWFIDALFNPDKKIHYAGQMLASARETDADKITLAAIPDKDITKDIPYYGSLKYAYYQLNLFGDPALSLWTKTPEKPVLQPDLTGAKFTLDTKGPYSWVALVDKDNNILITQQTGIDGICSIEDAILTQYLAANPGTALKVRVKAHNYLPDSVVVSPTGSIKQKNYSTNSNSCILTQHNNTLKVNYTLYVSGTVTIAIYSLKGEVLLMPVHRKMNTGRYAETIPLNLLSCGMYYCTVSCGDWKNGTKICIVK